MDWRKASSLTPPTTAGRLLMIAIPAVVYNVHKNGACWNKGTLHFAMSIPCMVLLRTMLSKVIHWFELKLNSVELRALPSSPMPPVTCGEGSSRHSPPTSFLCLLLYTHQNSLRGPHLYSHAGVVLPGDLHVGQCNELVVFRIQAEDGLGGWTGIAQIAHFTAHHHYLVFANRNIFTYRTYSNTKTMCLLLLSLKRTLLHNALS